MKPMISYTNQSQELDRIIMRKILTHIKKHIEENPSPTFKESLIPIWGSSRKVLKSYNDVKYGWVVFHGACVISEAF